MFLIWIVIIGATAWFLVNTVNRGRAEAPGNVRMDHSLAILNERYAKGEIDREKYLSMKKDLEGTAT